MTKYKKKAQATTSWHKAYGVRIYLEAERGYQTPPNRRLGFKMKM